MAGGLGFDGGSSVVLPPLELAYMAATLVDRGVETTIIDADVEGLSAAEIHATIEAAGFDAILATVSLPNLLGDCAFLAGARERTSARILAKTGVSHPPVLKEILERSEADLCIWGECDTIIDEVITRDSTLGTAYLRDGELIVERNMVVENLDQLPIPARHLLPNDEYRYHLLGGTVTSMQTTRGCPYSCGYFCPYPLVQGKKWRARSPEHVVREIEDVVVRHGIDRILFRDATFTLDQQRTSRICELILERGLNVRWWCETRVDCLTPELLTTMQAAGCEGINVGVETGDEEIMSTLAKKGLTLHRLGLIREAAREIGLRLHFLLMIGLPNETRKSIYETQRLLASLKPDSIGVCVITPYPGTPLHAEAVEKGWIETDDWARFGGHTPIMHTDHLSTAELDKAQRMLHRAFALGRRSPLRASVYDAYFKAWANG